MIVCLLEALDDPENLPNKYDKDKNKIDIILTTRGAEVQQLEIAICYSFM